MNHIIKWEIFLESKSELITINNLRRYLDSEIPDIIIGLSIKDIKVRIEKKILSNNLLVIDLRYGDNRSISLVYKIKNHKFKSDFFQVIINGEKWTVRNDSGYIGDEIQSYIFMDLLKSKIRYEDIENIDNLVSSYLKNKKISE